MVTYQIDTLQIYLDLSMETRQLWKSEFLSQLNENSQSPDQYWLLLGQIRIQNPCFILKSDLWGELVSRVSSTYVFSYPLPFMLTWTNNITYFFLFLFVAISYFLFCSHTPSLYAVLSKLLLWNLCDRRFSCLKTYWTFFYLKSLIQIIIGLFVFSRQELLQDLSCPTHAPCNASTES